MEEEPYSSLFRKPFPKIVSSLKLGLKMETSKRPYPYQAQNESTPLSS